jgi:preprotein translocase subunit YajC
MMGVLPAVVPLQAAEPGGLDMSFFVVMGVIFLIFYVLVMRPQQKRQREHEEALKAVGKNDSVITTGGLHGLVSETADDVLTLEIARIKGSPVRVKVQRARIESIVKADAKLSAIKDDGKGAATGESNGGKKS